VPVVGTKPKPDGQKRNRVKPTFDWIDVPDVPYAGKPPVAAKQDWPAATKRWWRVVSRMPHCVLWTDGDWQFAFDTGLIAAVFHGGDMRVATELRQREKILGTTGDARRDLRIRYVAAPSDVDGEDDATVTAMADYRAMLADD
jgi:hypothetical protein